jgi:hypothetical protein
MFKQIAYPFSAGLASSLPPTALAPVQQPTVTASSVASRDFPWLWLLLLTSLGLLVWWWSRLGPAGRATAWTHLVGPPVAPPVPTVPTQPIPLAAAIK